jgi:predicted nucleic acid-binding protein
MTAELTFIDTNVLVYAHDRSAGAKHLAARRLVAHLWDTRSGTLSTQVLQEFHVIATRKLPKPLAPERARRVLRRYATWPVQLIEPPDILHASELSQRHRMSFWDALIVTCALRSGATVLATEDLQAGRRLSGIRIENPFVGEASSSGDSRRPGPPASPGPGQQAPS